MKKRNVRHYLFIFILGLTGCTFCGFYPRLIQMYPGKKLPSTSIALIIGSEDYNGMYPGAQITEIDGEPVTTKHSFFGYPSVFCILPGYHTLEVTYMSAVGTPNHAYSSVNPLTIPYQYYEGKGPLATSFYAEAGKIYRVIGEVKQQDESPTGLIWETAIIETPCVDPWKPNWKPK